MKKRMNLFLTLVMTTRIFVQTAKSVLMNKRFLLPIAFIVQLLFNATVWAIDGVSGARSKQTIANK